MFAPRTPGLAALRRDRDLDGRRRPRGEGATARGERQPRQVGEQVVLDVDEHDVVGGVLVHRPQRTGRVGLEATALARLLAREPPRVHQRAVVGVDLQQAGGPVRGEVGVPDGVERLVVGQAHHLGQRRGAEGQQRARVVVRRTGDGADHAVRPAADVEHILDRVVGETGQLQRGPVTLDLPGLLAGVPVSKQWM